MRVLTGTIIALLFFAYLIAPGPSPAPPTPAPQSVPFQYPLSAFVEINVYLALDILAVGTGSIVYRDGELVYILTAAHVCDNPKFEVMSQNRNLPLFLVVNEGIGHVVASNVALDTCLVVSSIYGSPIRIAEHPPEVGDMYYSMTNPQGLADYRSLIPLISGRYAGFREERELPAHQQHNVDVYMLYVTGGSSGSAILNERRELVGIITHTMLDYNAAAISPRYSELRDWLLHHLPQDSCDYPILP